MTDIGGGITASLARRRRVVILGVICAVAFAARMAVLVLIPDLVHTDEIQQYAEQAFRAVEGHGLVPWEYRAGIRSWVLPGLLIPWMAVARLVGAGPPAHRPRADRRLPKTTRPPVLRPTAPSRSAVPKDQAA